MNYNGKSVIEINENALNYKKIDTKFFNKTKFLFLIILVFIIFLFSVILCVLQNFEWTPLQELNTFKRIKKTMNSWSNIVNEKTGIEINKGKLLYLSKPDIAEFSCIDYGLYYAAGRLNENIFLPQFIMRGNSGPWIIKKADTVDEPAKQFCEFLLSKKIDNNNIITCGKEMYEKLGYSGYFTQNSPCENFISNFSK